MRGAFTDKDKHVINGGTLNFGDDTTKNVTVKVDAKKRCSGAECNTFNEQQ